MITPLLQAAKTAAKTFNQATNQQRQNLVRAVGKTIRKNKEIILEANKKDLAKMNKNNPLFDRLLFTAERLNGIANACEAVANLEDPTQKVLAKHKHNGLDIQKISVPMGVVGAIFEARPNVTIDICVLSLRSGNAAVLKGGSDAYESNKAIISLIHKVLKNHDFPTETLQLLPPGREYVAEFLAAKDYVDILIPRGSKRLINFVRDNAKIPTIETGAGVCHTYVDKDADVTMAARIIENAKISRPSVCNCLDTIVLHVDVAEKILIEIQKEFEAKKIGIWADARSYAILERKNYSFLHVAKSEDFGREFLSLNCSIKVVDSYAEAVTHINKHSSTHSEAIVTKDTSLAERFLNEVDAACVFVNSSTRFADGEVFGLGAEIGISTQKLHARGPFALEKLVTEKWFIQGNGQIR